MKNKAKYEIIPAKVPIAIGKSIDLGSLFIFPLQSVQFCIIFIHEFVYKVEILLSAYEFIDKIFG